MNVNQELEANRRNTAEFIRRDPARVVPVLSREDLVWDGGSFTRQNQRQVRGHAMALIASVQQLPERRTVEGQSLTPEFILLGEYGADILNGDWFYIEGVKYEVVFVHPDRSYQTKAEVVYRG
jgi:hypothetical protein